MEWPAAVRVSVVMSTVLFTGGILNAQTTTPLPNECGALTDASVLLTPIDPVYTAGDNVYSTTPGETQSVPVPGFLFDDTLSPNTTRSIVMVTCPVYGRLFNLAGGGFSYMAPNGVSEDHFSYLVVMTAGTISTRTNIATVTMRMTPPPSPPMPPLLFIHGFCSNAETWNELTSALQNEDKDRYGIDLARLYFDGQYVLEVATGQPLAGGRHPQLFTVDFFDPRQGVREDGFLNTNVNDISIAHKAWEVRQVVEEIRQITNSEKVILVGHSLGGLAARAYVEGLASTTNFDGLHFSYQGDVARLITIDTPHAGTTFAEFSTGPFNILCQGEPSVNKGELQKRGSRYSIANLLDAQPLPVETISIVTQTAPTKITPSSDIVSASSILKPQAGDGLVPYDSQNLLLAHGVTGAPFTGQNVVADDNVAEYSVHDEGGLLTLRFDLPVDPVPIFMFHSATIRWPQTIALVRKYTETLDEIRPPLRARLDSPSKKAMKVIDGSGWAFECGESINDYVVLLDDVPVPSAIFSFPQLREDIRAQFRAECPTIGDQTGFEFTIDTAVANVSNGLHRVQVQVTDTQQRVTTSNMLWFNVLAK